MGWLSPLIWELPDKLAVTTVGDVGLRFCDVMLLCMDDKWVTTTDDSVPNVGSKRLKAGDSGWFVKFVRVLPIDSVCGGSVTGAGLAAMAEACEPCSWVRCVTSWWFLESCNRTAAAWSSAPPVLSSAIPSKDSIFGIAFRL